MDPNQILYPLFLSAVQPYKWYEELWIQSVTFESSSHAKVFKQAWNTYALDKATRLRNLGGYLRRSLQLILTQKISAITYIIQRTARKI